jgi:hypothetical protein
MRAFDRELIMNTRFPQLKKFAGMAVMAMAVAAVGLSLGSGTAQAAHMHHTHSVTTFNQRVDNSFDHIQALFRIGEGTRLDNRIDMRFGVS